MDSFYSYFGANYNYTDDENGHIHLLFGKFDNYEEFVKNYFGTFLLKMFAFKVDIVQSEANNEIFVGLSDFLARFVPEYLKTYSQISKELGFKRTIM